MLHRRKSIEIHILHTIWIYEKISKKIALDPRVQRFPVETELLFAYTYVYLDTTLTHQEEFTSPLDYRRPCRSLAVALGAVEPALSA